MMRKLLILAACASLSACATTGAADPRDPYEGFNRGVFAFNDGLDKAVVKPATTVYRTVTPVPARRGFSRVLSNLMEPLHFVNNLLQGKPKRALNSLGRFVVNTTIGVGGLADHATGMGMPSTSEDFGQTFAVWGAKNSPYVVLPLLGPSTVRDAAGTGLQFFVDPVGIALDEAGASGELKAGVTALRVIDGRSRVMDTGYDAVLATSADPYATARDAYLQRRELDIADQQGAAPADTLSDADQQRLLDEALEQNPTAEDSPPGAEPETPPVEPEVPPAEPEGGMAAADAPLPVEPLGWDEAVAGY